MKKPFSLYLSYQSSLKRIKRFRYYESDRNPDIYCGVMKFLADMPSRLGGEDNRINVA